MFFFPAFFINLLLKVVKYPIAILACIALPSLVVDFISTRISSLDPIFLGSCFLYALIMFLFPSIRAFQRFVTTITHELTHAFFATLTGHRVVNIRVTLSAGGRCQFLGPLGGNWLITTSPYWIPLLPMLLVLLAFVSQTSSAGYRCLLGVTLALHFHSLCTDIHWRQPDLREAGWLFSLLFLPSAVCTTYGILLGVNPQNIGQSLHGIQTCWTGAILSLSRWLLGESMSDHVFDLSLLTAT